MPTSTNVTNLKINELTEAQYDTAVQGGVIGANELSILTDADYATINDNSTSSLTETWSASKLNTMIGDVETLLAQI